MPNGHVVAVSRILAPILATAGACSVLIRWSPWHFCLEASGGAGFSSSIPRGGERSRKNCASCWIWSTRWGRRSITFICCTDCGAGRERRRRARFARELHDGAVQSLIAVEMQVDVMRRQAEAGKPIGGGVGTHPGTAARRSAQVAGTDAADESDRCGCAASAREFLNDTVERFQRETGISARFVTDLEELDMPQRVCREILRIVQEGLVNVRKHSGARHALVRLGSNQSKWSLDSRR